ncbi:hypothetical protein [Syntrophus aciditrophicus]|uniref:Hypothetical cytosolic protein n=1 Tax=Syntrophus aciditrophicus (strain SB) TaxID=56780 RepID=Q2LWY0_SYNAS|nr:hypothetical protein [Syntrophus aciditrophicus]ABC78588.1 hypothetical cytosolic protein [Syntrophus aciditrophicus SB]OPY16523.1 MAG: hypothetical protein A4E74_01797 [Syntrophus sp. PtaB.Bin075]
MKPDKLIILDYSGTLSLQAVLFGRQESLQAALEQSGLSRLGVTPSLFWNEIVNPTWREGSTTRVGYKRVMIKRLRKRAAFRHPGATPLTGAGLEKAVADFVDAYLAASRMEKSWRSILRILADRRDVCTIIATDHYAEATPAILNFLAEWNIPALPAEKAFSSRRPAVIIVANSADLGMHKTTPYFWLTLKSGLELQNLREILLLDDFGYNEQAGDAYGEKTCVEIRQEQTSRLLRDVFSAKLDVFPFFLDRRNNPEAYERLMIQVGLCIDRFLGKKI